uniref:Uncharacterized protein n=1 Tax=Sphaerodactylus townsendi TaxID=933632 RepID=A0ACB8ENP5_9SAUR
MSSSRGVNWTPEEVEVMLQAVLSRGLAPTLIGSGKAPNRKLYAGVSKAMARKGHTRNPTQVQNKWKALKKEFFKATAAFQGEPTTVGWPKHYSLMPEAWLMAGRPDPATNRKGGSTACSSREEMGSQEAIHKEVGTEEETSSRSVEVPERRDSDTPRERDTEEDRDLERRLAVVERWLKKRKGAAKRLLAKQRAAEQAGQ